MDIGKNKNSNSTANYVFFKCMFKYGLIVSNLIEIVTVFDIFNYLLINGRIITCFSSFIYSKLKTIEVLMQFFVHFICRKHNYISQSHYYSYYFAIAVCF